MEPWRQLLVCLVLRDADADLADTTGCIDDDDVGDDYVACVAHGGGLQQQTVTRGLAETGQELVAAFLRIELDLDDQTGIAQAHPISNSWAVNGGVIVRKNFLRVHVAVRYRAVVVAVLELAVRMAVRVAVIVVGVAHEAAPR